MSAKTLTGNSFQATTFNLWLSNVDFEPSKSTEVSCFTNLRDKYHVLKPTKFISSSSRPEASASPLKPLVNHNGVSKKLFNAASSYSELTISPKSQTNVFREPNGSLKLYSNDSLKSQVNGSKQLPESDVPRPKHIIDNLENPTLEWTFQKRIGPGLLNLGNTCFMNSVIQCLTYCPPFSISLVKGDHTAKCTNRQSCMACVFIDHLREVFANRQGVISPKNFAQKLKLVCKSFNWGRQEDAHEYLRHLIDNMCRMAVSSAESKKNKAASFGLAFKFDSRSKETTMFNHIFGGYLRSQITCLSCKSTSNTYDHFMDLMLDIKKVDSLLGAFEKFTSREKLDNENSYKCTHCKRKSEATKQFSIHTPPNVLTIQLKRFEFNRFYGKLTKHVNFPEDLNLQRFMSDSSTHSSGVSYKLFAVLVHQGNTCNSGHYYCYVKNSNQMWYRMDDSSVSSSSINHVLLQNAYILFYVKKPKGKLNGLNISANLTSQTTQNSYNKIANSNGQKIPMGMNGQQVTANNSKAKVVGVTSSKFIGPMPPKKPFLSDPTKSPLKSSLQSNTSMVVIKPGGNKPALILDKPKQQKNGEHKPVSSNSQVVVNGSSNVESGKRLVDYSDESESDEPINKKLKQNDGQFNGIKIFSNSSSSNSVSSLSDHSSHSSRDNTPPSKENVSDSTVPVMNGSKTVITKDIIHKSSNFVFDKVGTPLDGFGPKVKSWTGTSNCVDEEVAKEKEQDVRIDREDEEYNREFDAGKTKKVKKLAHGDGLLFQSGGGGSRGGNLFDSHQNGNKQADRSYRNRNGPFKTHQNNRHPSFRSGFPMDKNRYNLNGFKFGNRNNSNYKKNNSYK